MNHPVWKKLLASAVLAAMLLTQSARGPARTAGAQEDGTDTVSAKLNMDIPAWALKEAHRYTFDFTEEDSKYYSKHEALNVQTRTGFKVTGGRLTADQKRLFVLTGRNYLGDDYGIKGGSLGFTLSQTEGKITVLLRDINDVPAKDDGGLKFVFSGSGLQITDTSSKTKAALDVSGYLDGGKEARLEFVDRPDCITLLINSETVFRAEYTENAGGYSVSNYSASLRFYDGSGNKLAETDSSILQRAGRFVLAADGFGGYIDDLFFDYSEIDQSLPEASEARAVNYGNWVATDDLARITSLSDTVGTVRQNKEVGIFYFLCWVGAGIHVQDNTKLYLELGADGLKKYLSERGGEAYWAEPYFGYYRNTDTWVYRRHAYMLEAAGIDFIFLDVSNAVVFEDGHTALFDTWLQIRKEGGHTPQICFLTGDDPKTFESDVKKLRRTVYSEKNWDKYSELFYLWEGKPLIFGNISGVNEETRTYLNENFTVRGCWAWCDENGYWNWLDETWKNADGTWSQHKGRDLNGNFESVAVAAGHHPASSKGRSYVNGSQPNNDKSDFMFSYEDSRLGLGFISMWESAIKMDPPVVMVTGWNEWIAGNSRGSNYMANTRVNDVNYVDQFNPEFSRDVEPMKLRDGVGFGDVFYYQLVDWVRKFKGTDGLSGASGQKTLDITDTAAWTEVGPEFRDHIGDVEFRNTVGYDASYRYINGSGRNDFDAAKVSQDSRYLYFTVSTVNDIVKADDPTWMNLLIDTDMDHATGWEGYNYVLNRSRDGETLTVEKFDGNSWTSVKAGDAEYYISGKYFAVRVDKTLLGFAEGDNVNFDFKWTDNSTETGEIMEFMDLGDTAPDGRFNFRYVSDGKAYEKHQEAVTGVKKAADPGPFIAVGATALRVIGAAAALVILNKKKKEQ